MYSATYFIGKGKADKTIYLELRSSSTNQPVTGGTLTGAYYTRERTLETSISLSTLGSVDAAHSDGGYIEVDATNCPGLYRLDLPDAAIADGSPYCILTVKGTGLVPLSILIMLDAPVDVNSVREDQDAADNVQDFFVLNGPSTTFEAWLDGFETGTAQSGSTNQTIKLASGASSTNDKYQHRMIYLRSGSGAGQVAFIHDYIGSTRVASILPEWHTLPDTTTVYLIIPISAAINVWGIRSNDYATGLALLANDYIDDSLINVNVEAIDATVQAGVVDAVYDEDYTAHTTANTLGANLNGVIHGTAVTGTLTTNQMSTNLTEATSSHYHDRVIVWISGALKGQTAQITAYNGSTKVFTFTAVTEAPANGDKFIIV